MRLDMHRDVADRPPRRRCGPTCPLPATRMRAPSASPAGTWIVSGSLRISTCWPPQAGQRDLPLPPGPAAVRARLREHHVPARRLHRARAVALRAAALGGVQPAGAAARAAALLPRHRDVPLPAAHRLFEGDRDRLMQIRAALRLVAPALRRALLQDVGEEIAEGRRRRPADADREVEPLEAERRLLDRRRRSAPAASYRRRRSGSLSVSYASAIWRNCAAAMRSPGLMSG